MSTSESVIPEQFLLRDRVIVNPGCDIQLSVDAIGAFGETGTLRTEGSEDAAVVASSLAQQFSPVNAIAVLDGHVPGSAHADTAYNDLAGIVPNVTTLTEERIDQWIRIGEEKILRPSARFSLRSLRADARLTRMFTGGDQVVWAEHATMGSTETLFIAPLTPNMFGNIFFKGTHPLHDSHSAVWDAVGNPTGVMNDIASRQLPIRAVFIDGNALEVCIFLTAMNLSRFGIAVYIVTDGVGFLPFISDDNRLIIIKKLVQAGVKFTHTSLLTFS